MSCQEALSRFGAWVGHDQRRFQELQDLYRAAQSDDEAVSLMAEEIAKRYPEMEREAGVAINEIMWASVVLAVKKMCSLAS
jgi:hypothetical protein